MAKGEDFLGGGLAKGAADTLKLRQQYNAYRENAISSGEQVLTFEQWLKEEGHAMPVNMPK